MTNTSLSETEALEGASAAVGRSPRAPQQDRGQKRVNSILEAAGEVIAEVGLEAATMQAIADRAGASMGSLYHFFPNKDAIIEALARLIVTEVSGRNAAVMPVSMVVAPLDELFGRIVKGHFDFCETHPSYMAVLEGTRHAPWGRAVHDELDRAIVGQVVDYLEARLPGMEPAQRQMAARVAVTAVDSVIHEAQQAAPEDRDRLQVELQRMLTRYFEPYEREYGITITRPAGY